MVVITPRRLIVAGLITAILLGYIGPVKGYLDQRSQLGAERARLAALEERRDEYKAQLAALGRPDVLEERARELGLVQPGERPFVVNGDLEPPPPEPQEHGDDGGPFGWLTGVF
jgi:cell division protein FtsB